MQTIEKALHQPMPFTTGGQTITDRLTAAKHSLAGSQLGKTICKATTEELMAPKKKHLDYLLHCTNEPNVSIPSMANMLIERTQNVNWTVVYKSLITIHNIMCYGNERFSQYLASCNTTFNLGGFLDKASTQGYDMSQHVRKYGKYISEKIGTYRTCAFDFCKVKRGREDGLLRTMHTDKLLKTLPTLQNQIDALLEFQVSASELNNGVINCSFILLFRDLIRLFACYNDGVINLLEKYFDMNKKQCREALDMYKAFLTRLDKVSEFLRVAESVGIDKGEIPDLTRAPASLLEALEAHLIHLEGGRPPPPANPFPQASSLFQAASGNASSHTERARYLEYEKQRLREIEEENRKRPQGASSNPFAMPSLTEAPQAGGGGRPSDDLLDLFNPAPLPPTTSAAGAAFDSTNPFASYPAQQQSFVQMYNQQPAGAQYGQNSVMAANSSMQQQQTFGDFGRAFGQQQMQQQPLREMPEMAANPFMTGWGEQPTASAESIPAPPTPAEEPIGANPFAMDSAVATSAPYVPPQPITTRFDGSYNTNSPLQQAVQQGAPNPFGIDQMAGMNQQNRITGDIDTALSSLANNLDITGNSNQGKPVQWGAPAGSRPPAPLGYPGVQQQAAPNPFADHMYQQQQAQPNMQWAQHPTNPAAMYQGMPPPPGYGIQPVQGYGMYPSVNSTGAPSNDVHEPFAH